MNTEILLSLLPWLAALACPVMMFWMMRGTAGARCHTQQPREGARGDAETTDVTNVGGGIDDEIRDLKMRLARLEARKHDKHEMQATR